MNRRYWLVFFTGNYDKSTFKGNIPIISYDGYFLNKRMVCNDIEDQYGFDEIVITNFKELTNKEYNEWTE